MKAKDTIMTTTGCNKFRDDSCVRNCCNTRADKAYKAALKEVTEWFLSHKVPQDRDCEMLTFLPCEIPAKLNEWGIEVPK